MTPKISPAALLEADLIAAGIPPQLEHRPFLEARWRFDLAYPTIKLAIELDGAGRQGRLGGHQTHSGRIRDMTKANAAIEHGWRVLRYPTSSIKIHKRRDRIVEQIFRIACSVQCLDSAKIVLEGD